MIQTITINKVDYRISKDPKDFFADNPIAQRKCFVAIDMMEDCLDYISACGKIFLLILL